MSGHSAHAEHVYSCAHQKSALSPIVASWRRCMTVHNLAPEQTRRPHRLTEAELNIVREAAGQLEACASDELDRLFSMLGKAGCCILLTDRSGVALERRGTAADDREFQDLGLWTGTVWTEASVGTNGIGTAIADERAVSVHRGQHFLSTNVGLSCTSAPIRDHKGAVAGVLDISTCRYDAGETMLSILAQAVRDAAARIELNLFRAAFPGARFIMLPNETAAALLAVDRHDLVLGATRSARSTLKLDDRRIEAGLPAADLLQDAAVSVGEDLDELERAMLRRVLSRERGNVSRAAASMGISRATLYRKLKKFHLQG